MFHHVVPHNTPQLATQLQIRYQALPWVYMAEIAISLSIRCVWLLSDVYRGCMRRASNNLIASLA